MVPVLISQDFADINRSLSLFNANGIIPSTTSEGCLEPVRADSKASILADLEWMENTYDCHGFCYSSSNFFFLDKSGGGKATDDSCSRALAIGISERLQLILVLVIVFIAIQVEVFQFLLFRDSDSKKSL
mmetsp:Transcript_12200/g.13331  ORF Transcript_12200/g.13331 Transcript_12200/m.13331 type:complete len:130 (-) Transcript_12200:501-890(-)